MNVFTDELERAEALALSCVVIHPGSHLGAGRASGLACATRALNEALRRTADIRTAAGWSAAVDELVARVGVRGVLTFHLNDAASGLASGLDRHEHIGRGQVGLVPFRALLNDPRFAAIPKVLETPQDPEPRMDRANLARLRRLRCPIDGWSRRHADTTR